MRGSRSTVRLRAGALALAMALVVAGDAAAQEKKRRVPRGRTGPVETEHTVQPGETLDQIARKYGVDPDWIRLKNGLVTLRGERPRIYVGQVLVIPKSLRDAR